MDRLLERLRRGEGPPLRISEFALVIGCGISTAKRLIRDEVVQVVQMPGMTEKRIPIYEAARYAREAKVLKG